MRLSLKLEATKFTEVGYVGRDVESWFRDLVENAIQIVKRAIQKTFGCRQKKANRRLVKYWYLESKRAKRNPRIHMNKWWICSILGSRQKNQRRDWRRNPQQPSSHLWAIRKRLIGQSWSNDPGGWTKNTVTNDEQWIRNKWGSIWMKH